MQPTLPPSVWMTKAYMNDLNFEKKAAELNGDVLQYFSYMYKRTLINCEWLRKLIRIDRQEPPTKELREVVTVEKLHDLL